MLFIGLASLTNHLQFLEEKTLEKLAHDVDHPLYLMNSDHSFSTFPTSLNKLPLTSKVLQAVAILETRYL